MFKLFTPRLFGKAVLLSAISCYLLVFAQANAKDLSSDLNIASNNTPQATTGLPTLPPIGWVQFCRDYARDRRAPCNISATPAVDIVLDTIALRELNRINNAVNAEITPVTDMEHWGLPDRWDYPDDKKGDCEDYVLEKRERLMKRGFPRSALLVTVVRDKAGDGHAVLTIKTDKGDYILDNQVATILPWVQTDYRFIKRQSQNNPNIWVSIEPQELKLTSAR